MKTIMIAALLGILFLAAGTKAAAAAEVKRETICFDQDWCFHIGEVENGHDPGRRCAQQRETQQSDPRSHRSCSFRRLHNQDGC
ncbi:MAG: hypothetical protein ACLP9L_20210 [Thermoguttaceae bacterium]